MTRATSTEEAIQLFGMANLLAEHDLDRIEDEFSIDLQRGVINRVSVDETYYPQIEMSIRAAAARMAPHYEVFYALETTIRGLIADALTEAHGEGWWDAANVPQTIKTECDNRRRKEIDTGMTPRSVDPLDFTTFGELGEIIKANWDAFGGMMRSQRAVERVMSSLNSLRGPIAHCSPLAEDEVVRLRLSVQDWFRLME